MAANVSSRFHPDFADNDKMTSRGRPSCSAVLLFQRVTIEDLPTTERGGYGGHGRGSVWFGSLLLSLISER